LEGNNDSETRLQLFVIAVNLITSSGWCNLSSHTERKS